MQRRDFLKRVGSTGLAAAATMATAVWLRDQRSAAEFFREQEHASTLTLPSYQVGRAAGSVELAIARGQDPTQLVIAALDALGGIRSFVGRNDVVLIKPNAAFDRPPAFGATTRPEVLHALARLCREAGARRVIVTDNPINQPTGCFAKSGLEQAAAEAGAELFLPRPSAFTQVRVNGEALQTWPLLHAPLQQATRVIGLAPCKDHNLCGASMTMKNWYGLLGGRRNQFHQQIHQVVADFAAMIRPTLVLLDATRLLRRNGPTGGSLGDVEAGDTLVAGTDMVAVDTIGCELLGRRLEAVAYLGRAEARGLGSTRWRERPWKEVQVG
jgi:uncharacterized protein (DUF362 family)